MCTVPRSKPQLDPQSTNNLNYICTIMTNTNHVHPQSDVAATAAADNDAMNLNFELDESSGSVLTGGQISGDLVIRVTQTVKASKLVVYFEGKEYTTVKSCKQVDRHRRHKSVRKEIHGRHLLRNVGIDVEDEAEVIRNGVIEPGTYELPFEFDVPLNIPSSLAVQRGSNTAAVVYSLHAEVKGTDYNTQCLVRVVADAQGSNNNGPYLVPPKEERVSKSCCWLPRKGKLMYGAKLLETQFHRGQRPKVKMSIVNDSAATLQTVHVTLRQVVEFHAHNGRAAIVNILCASRFQQDLQEQQTRHTKSSRKQTKQRMLDELQDCDHETWALPPVPSRVQNTWEGELISIAHEIVITMKTEGNFTNPELVIPVQILPGSFSSGGTDKHKRGGKCSGSDTSSDRDEIESNC